jgi:hypothetical protein
MINYFGMSIVPHRLALEIRDEWRVERHPIKKKRRNWRVVKHRINRPCAIQCGSVIYMHPDLIALLPQGSAAR